MIEQLNEIDRKLFFLLNSRHAPWLDSVMINLTNTMFWIPLYIILLYIILKDFRNDSWAPLIGIFLTILIADQVASTVIKPVVQRLRPTHDPAILLLVHTVSGYRGGEFGFVSSHAANTSGTTLFLMMLLPQRKKLMVLLCFWVGMVGYSRIYLGVHYPGDIVGGFLVGAAAALIGFKVHRMLYRRFGRNRSPDIHQ